MPLDFQDPDYIPIFTQRRERLLKLRADPILLAQLKTHYRLNPAKFITDWGCTTDPRNIEVGRPALVPFILFPRQEEWLEWVMDSWRNRRPGVTPKSRESGVSWLAIALSCTLCLFNEYMTIGFGSYKAELVDKLGDPKSLFWKAREFIKLLPAEFRGKWTVADTSEMLIRFPETNSSMIGEGGYSIGRGGRTSIYFVDEAAHLERPDLAEASLSQTTNCRIDISTPFGLGGPFHKKVTTWPSERVFLFHWRDDPRKSEAWYEDQKTKLDPVVIAQEIDIDFAASVEGVLIPSSWVQAAVDAHVKLGITPTGRRSGALDVADEGRDRNAFCGAHGPLVEVMEEWSGKGDDIFGTVERAFMLCDDNNYIEFRYDADGLGAGVRGDARIINDSRSIKVNVNAFRGSGHVHNPEGQDVKGRKNQDFFSNAKAQSWWNLRVRFQRTHRWVTGGEACACHPDDIISISSDIPMLSNLCAELSRPTYSVKMGKIIIDKTPNGSPSPNMADALMIKFCTASRSLRISDELLLSLGM